jgi:hypothetical protein
VVADKAYDSEDYHIFVRKLHAFNIIPSRYELKQMPILIKR